jgi:hypothetical protein
VGGVRFCYSYIAPSGAWFPDDIDVAN